MEGRFHFGFRPAIQCNFHLRRGRSAPPGQEPESGMTSLKDIGSEAQRPGRVRWARAGGGAVPRAAEAPEEAEEAKTRRWGHREDPQGHPRSPALVRQPHVSRRGSPLRPSPTVQCIRVG